MASASAALLETVTPATSTRPASADRRRASREATLSARPARACTTVARSVRDAPAARSPRRQRTTVGARRVVGALVAERVERPRQRGRGRPASRRARSRRRCCGRRSCSRAADRPARARGVGALLDLQPRLARIGQGRRVVADDLDGRVVAVVGVVAVAVGGDDRDVAQRPPGAGFGRDRVDDDLDGAFSAQQRQFAAQLLTVAAAVGRAVVGVDEAEAGGQRVSVIVTSRASEGPSLTTTSVKATGRRRRCGRRTRASRSAGRSACRARTGPQP